MDPTQNHPDPNQPQDNSQPQQPSHQEAPPSSSQPESSALVNEDELEGEEDEDEYEDIEQSEEPQQQAVLEQMGLEEMVGCEHYKRNCLVEAPCCKIFYSCKLCHDEKYQGPKAQWCKVQRMEFDKVAHLKCLKCDQIQQPSQKCSNPECEVRFGEYACLKCMLYENNPVKVNDIFHCDDCKMCRRGKRQRFYHCMLCGYCRHISQKNNHKCSQNIASGQCPICLETLLFSVKYYQPLPCGHLIHTQCLMKYRQINCPVCGMAIVKQDERSKKETELLIERTTEHMPQELRDKKVDVLCNECLFKTKDASFHFMGVKCGSCGSFNTKMM